MLMRMPKCGRAATTIWGRIGWYRFAVFCWAIFLGGKARDPGDHVRNHGRNGEKNQAPLN